MELLRQLLIEVTAPSRIAKHYKRTAYDLRKNGGYIDINYKQNLINVKLPNGKRFKLAGKDATSVLSDVPDNVNAEDYILSIHSGV